MKFTKIMGLKLSKIRVVFKKPRLLASLTGTTATYDTVKKQLTKALEMLAEYATIAKSQLIHRLCRLRRIFDKRSSDEESPVGQGGP